MWDFLSDPHARSTLNSGNCDVTQITVKRRSLRRIARSLRMFRMPTAGRLTAAVWSWH